MPFQVLRSTDFLALEQAEYSTMMQTLLCIFFLSLMTAGTLFAEPFGEKRLPKTVCSELIGNSDYSRPIFSSKASVTVVDVENDGAINGTDLQHAINKASDIHETTGLVTSIRFTENTQVVELERTIILRTGTLLEGNSNRPILFASTAFKDQHLVDIADGSTDVGLVNLTLSTQMRAISSGVHLGPGSDRVYVYDNLFIDEAENLSNARTAIGPGTGISMIRLSGDSQHVYIVGNSFTHIPTAISLTGTRLQYVWISQNHIANWRQRAIYLVNNASSSVVGIGSISDVHLIHNEIGPPKLGSIRQPIAAQVLHVGEHRFQRVEVSFNTIVGPDLPHDRKTTNNATADSISLHSAENFSVHSNCIFNSGEVGITISLGSMNGEVKGNYIENADTSGIAIGSMPGKVAYRTTGISVTDNIIVNPARDRLGTLPAWARSSIGFTNAQGNVFNRNTTVVDNELIGEPFHKSRLAFVYYEKDASQNKDGGLNVEIVPENVVVHGHD